jgi:hypothetical protein
VVHARGIGVGRRARLNAGAHHVVGVAEHGPGTVAQEALALDARESVHEPRRSQLADRLELLGIETAAQIQIHHRGLLRAGLLRFERRTGGAAPASEACIASRSNVMSRRNAAMSEPSETTDGPRFQA